MRLGGYHHLSAITADARSNRAFYSGVLGMRMVKRIVNQDQVTSWHLAFGDAVGTPGSSLTFFEWQTQPEQRGTGAIVRIGLRVPSDSLDCWAGRLRDAGIEGAAIDELAGRPGISFADPEGQRLRLVADPRPGGQPWADSPVPPEHQIRGLGTVVLSVHDAAESEWFLTSVLGMTVRDEIGLTGGDMLQVLSMDGEGPGAELHLIGQPVLPPSRQGPGGAHHLAFRTPDMAGSNAWRQRLLDCEMNVSETIDRLYFQSIYFREPGGNLLEIATDGPGFLIDEPASILGRRLALPRHLEPRRADIQAALRTID